MEAVLATQRGGARHKVDLLVRRKTGKVLRREADRPARVEQRRIAVHFEEPELLEGLADKVELSLGVATADDELLWGLEVGVVGFGAEDHAEGVVAVRVLRVRGGELEAQVAAARQGEGVHGQGGEGRNG